jgi:hypothetical protein
MRNDVQSTLQQSQSWGQEVISWTENEYRQQPVSLPYLDERSQAPDCYTDNDERKPSTHTLYQLHNRWSPPCLALNYCPTGAVPVYRQGEE